MTPEREREIRERTADLLAGATTPVRPAGVEQLGRDLAELLAYVDQLRARVENWKTACANDAERMFDAMETAKALRRQCAILSGSNQALRSELARTRAGTSSSSTGPAVGPIPDDAKTTDYCTVCGESPNSGSHIFGRRFRHTYQRPVSTE